MHVIYFTFLKSEKSDTVLCIFNEKIISAEEGSCFMKFSMVQ